jgi:DNA-binding response OmpR family regulator
MGRQRILLIDDSKEDRFLMIQALANAGLDFDVDEMCDADEAESYLIQKKDQRMLPTFVLLDFFLPKASAVETMQRWLAKGLADDVRVVVLSSVMTEGRREQLLSLGAFDVLEKPTDLDAFMKLGLQLKDLVLGDVGRLVGQAELECRSTANR